MDDTERDIGEPSCKKKKLEFLSAYHHVFNSDEILEILSFIPKENVKFIVMSCGLVSKQWRNVVVEYSKLDVTFVDYKLLEDLKARHHLNNIETLRVGKIVPNDVFYQVAGLMKHLTKLDVSNCQIGAEGAKWVRNN